MSGSRSKSAVLVALAMLALAALLGPGPGGLVPHQLPPLSPPSLPGSESVPGAPAGALGLEVVENPALDSAATDGLAAALVGPAGSPHDALLLATGSASGLSLASRGSVPESAFAAARAPRSPLGAIAAAERLVARGLGLREDLQSPVLEAARLAGIPARRASYSRELGPDALERATLRLYEALGLAVPAEQRVLLHERAAALAPELRDPAALILGAIADAQVGVEAALRKLEPDEYELLWSCGETSRDGRRSCPDPGRAAQVAATRLDRAAILDATLGVLSAVEQALPGLQAYARSALVPSQVAVSPAGSEADGDLFADPYNLVQIGGFGPDMYTGNTLNSPLFDPATQVLTIDPGGGDLYLNSAGGTSARGLFLVDASGLTPSQYFGFSFGVLVSVGIDLGGGDSYSATSRAQGSGKLGIGLLLDLAGADSYSASSESQGRGSAGVGLLVDHEGADSYACTWSCQGHGSQGGLGVLLDVAGTDATRGETWVQGVGYNGGAGFLLNALGDDAYTAVPSGGGVAIGQGASDLVGLGVLADGDGADSYAISSGGRGYVNWQPVPFNTGLGVFVDDAGLDAYSGSAPGMNGQRWFQGLPLTPLGVGWDR